MQGIKKYYVGIGILSLFTIMLLVYVLIQSSSFKNDKKVNEVAVSVAEELNDFVRKEQKVPESLSEVHSGDIPNEISYTKESSKRYKFCVTYSSQSGPELDAQSILYTGLSGDFATSYDDYESNYTPRTLYLSSYGWSAGEKCYTVEPTIYERTNSNNLFNSIDTDYLCDESYEYYDLYKNYCKDGKFDNN
jgi:hypothetical protein